MSASALQLHNCMLQIDLENEDDDGQDKGVQDFYTSSKPAVTQIVNSDSDSDLEYRPPVKR